MECIRAASLSKSYGPKLAVDRLDLGVECGQVFGFLGPNGAGKSTCIKMFTTLLRPSSGSLEVLGIDALREPLRVRSRIGVVLQQPSYEPTLSVEKSLDKYGMMWGVPAAERRRRASDLISEFGLEGARRVRNEDLSIGQRRRVQVAREFMHDMDLLFLDEPTVGMDPQARRGLMDYLRRRVSDGLTILYTTHVLSEVEYLCDTIAVVNGGRLVTTDTPESLRGRYGGLKTITIRVAGPPGSLERASMPGCLTDAGEGTVTIKSDSPEGMLSGALRALAAEGIQIEDIAVAPASLEDAFIRMVDDAPDS